MNRQGKWDESPSIAGVIRLAECRGMPRPENLEIDENMILCYTQFACIQAIMAQERKIGLQIAGKQRVRITIAG